jgi:hypothetical protein
MKEQNLDIKAGKLFFLSEGEYSDYGIKGHFLALVDINKELLAGIKNQCIADIKVDGYIGQYGRPIDINDEHDILVEVSEIFLGKLVASGSVMDIDVQEIHYSTYDSFELC